MFDTLVATIPPSFGDRRVLLLDGTTITLAPTPDLTRAFPPAATGSAPSAWPVWHGVVAHELASGCGSRPEAGPMYGPNGSASWPWRSGCCPACRPAPSSWPTATSGCSRSPTRPGRAATAVGPGVWKLNWEPSRWDRKNHPELPADAAVAVWLHEVVVSASLTLWLVTTLGNTSANLAALYRLRQDVETDIRDVKRTLRVEEMRGKSEDMVRKEWAMGMVAYNLVVQVRRLAAARAGGDAAAVELRRGVEPGEGRVAGRG